MQALHMNSLVMRNPDLISTEMGAETVMMSIDHGEYFRLNSVGGLVWGLLGQPQTVEAICAQLCANFQVDPTTCAQDVKTFLVDMHQKGIVTITEPALQS